MLLFGSECIDAITLLDMFCRQQIGYRDTQIVIVCKIIDASPHIGLKAVDVLRKCLICGSIPTFKSETIKVGFYRSKACLYSEREFMFAAKSQYISHVGIDVVLFFS